MIDMKKFADKEDGLWLCFTASALGKTIRENDIDSLYYFYGHDTAALESLYKRLVNKLCPADAQVMNFHKLDGKNLDFPMLTDACEACLYG